MFDLPKNSCAPIYKMKHSHSNSSMLPSPPKGTTKGASSAEDQENEMRRKLALHASLLEKHCLQRNQVDVVFHCEPKLVDEPPLKKKKRNRCFNCRKKVGLLGFDCRCGDVFCSSCRMPESHECTADWKTGIKPLEKIVAPKLDKL